MVLLFAAVTACLSGWATQASAADDVANFYKGKTVRVFVGTSAGSVYDSYARLLARNYGRVIPGNPTVIVTNMPGASGLTAVQYLDNGAPTDGSAMTLVPADMVIESLISANKVKTDFNNFSWIGSIDQDARVCYMWHTRQIKTFDDLLAKGPIVLGSTGPGVPSYVDGRILEVLMGVKVKRVNGYPGSPEKRVAIENGELDGDCGPWLGVPQDWLRDGKINLVLRTSETLAPGMPKTLPYLGDLIKDPKKQAIFRFLLRPKAMGRPFLISHLVPADRVQALREAFDKLMVDPEFLADVEKAKLTVAPMKGAEVAKLVKEVTDSPPDVVAAAKEIAR
jgi:tripartite-type tricarboxylate transporter receptor subunit TctC